MQQAANSFRPPSLGQGMPLYGANIIPTQPAKQNQEIEEQRMEEQIKLLRSQIVESESNLKAHEMALNSQKQVISTQNSFSLLNWLICLGKSWSFVDSKRRQAY